MSEGQLATAPLPTSGIVVDLMRSGFLSNLLSRRSYATYLATEINREVCKPASGLRTSSLAEGAWANDRAVVVLLKRPIAGG